MLRGILKLGVAVSCSLLSLQPVLAGNQIRLKNATVDTNDVSAQSALMSNEAAVNVRHYLVQFKSTITVQDQEMLKAEGARVLRYIPEDTYIVQINDLSRLRTLSSQASVQAVVPYVAQFKVNNNSLQTSVFNKNEKKELHVRAFENLDYDQIEAQLRQLDGLQVLGRDGSAFIVRARMDQISDIAKVDGLEWVDEYREINMQNFSIEGMLDTKDETEIPGVVTDLNGIESGTVVSGFEAAWKRGLNGAGQVVAVADTGLDTGDEASLNDEFNHLKKGIIGGLFSSTWGDANGHGTHVSGSIVSQGSKSGGKVIGGAYGASLVAESMWSEVYGRLTIGPDPTPIFAQAYEEGARIHSNSWGSNRGLGEYDDSARAADEYMWNHPDMLLVFAAGNSGKDANRDGRVDEDSISSPGTAKNVLTVGASENTVDKGGIQKKLGELGSMERGFNWPVAPLSEDTLSNNADGIAAFSSRGPTKDTRIKPDIVAPGTNILSQCSKFTGASELWGKFNDDLCFCGGTSMSTPLVSAGATVVRQYLVDRLNVTQPTAALVKAVLMHTTDDLYPGQFGEVGEANGQELLKPGPNSNQGYGRMNMDKATAGGLRVISSASGVKALEVHTYRIKEGTRKITLVYTDAPGSTAAEKALVNDLDLEVSVDGGQTFTSASKVNNNEQIELPANQTGIVLKVVGANVPVNSPEGGQPYAIVAN